MSCRRSLACVVVLVGCAGAGTDVGDAETGGHGSTQGLPVETGTGETMVAGTSGGSVADGTAALASTSDGGDSEASDEGGGITGCQDGVILDPPPGAWTPVGAGLVGIAAACTDVAAVAAQPCSARVVVGIENGGIRSSDDAGATWTALADGPGSASIDHRPMSILFDPLHTEVLWSAGIYGTHGLYRSVDGGTTFAALGDMTFSQLVAVDLADPERRTLVVGTHGQPRQVYLSTDGAQTWTNVGAAMPGDSHNSESPLLVDASTYLVGACGYGDGVCGIYRTTDAGASWVRASELQTSHFGGPLRTTDGTIYWPLFGEAGLARSTDDGQSWTQVVTGTVLGVTPLELADGSLATLSSTAVVRSTDDGVSWQAVTDPFPPIQTSLDTALTYSVGAQAFFVVRRDCATGVDAAIQRAGYPSP